MSFRFGVVVSIIGAVGFKAKEQLYLWRDREGQRRREKNLIESSGKSAEIQETNRIRRAEKDEKHFFELPEWFPIRIMGDEERKEREEKQHNAFRIGEEILRKRSIDEEAKRKAALEKVAQNTKNEGEKTMLNPKAVPSKASP